MTPLARLDRIERRVRRRHRYRLRPWARDWAEGLGFGLGLVGVVMLGGVLGWLWTR